MRVDISELGRGSQATSRFFLFIGCFFLWLGYYYFLFKAADHESLWESEEIYEYIICAICPVSGDYEPGKPECGFIFPAFNSRTEDPDYIDIYQSNPDFPQKDLLKILQIPE